MSIELFKSETISMEERIKNEYSNNEIGAFIDGALDIEEYFKSNLKIMWLIQEAYGEDSFSYPKFFMNEFSKFTKDLIWGKHKNTWQPIVYVTYAILNNYIEFETMHNLDIIKNPEIIKHTLNKIAFLNIQKSPSITGSSTIMKNLYNSYNKPVRKKLLHDQIELLNPRIVICGNTFPIIKESLGNIQRKSHKDSYWEYFESKNRIYINAYHPRQSKITRDKYVNGISLIVKDYLANHDA